MMLKYSDSDGLSPLKNATFCSKSKPRRMVVSAERMRRIEDVPAAPPPPVGVVAAEDICDIDKSLPFSPVAIVVVGPVAPSSDIPAVPTPCCCCCPPVPPAVGAAAERKVRKSSKPARIRRFIKHRMVGEQTTVAATVPQPALPVVEGYEETNRTVALCNKNSVHWVSTNDRKDGNEMAATSPEYNRKPTVTDFCSMR